MRDMIDAILWFLAASLSADAQSPRPVSTPPAAAPDEGLAARYPGDKGIDKDSRVLFATGFEDGFEGWTRTNAKICTLVKDPALAHSGATMCQATATRGQDAGGEISRRFAEGVDQLYLRFYCKFDKDTCWPHHFVKIRALAPGFDGNAGKAPPGDKGFWTGIEPLRGTWRLYTYWHKMRGWNNPVEGSTSNDDGTPNTGENDFYGNSFTPDGQPPVERDRWICVEAMMKANTVGKSDGEMTFWIDGRKTGHYGPGDPVGSWVRNVYVTSGPNAKKPSPFQGFDFRSDPKLQINEVALLWYVSEEYAAKGTATRNIVYFDDVVVATSYIGPMTNKAKR